MCIEIGVREERGERREEIGKGGAHARKRVERRDLSGALDGQCIEATETKAVFRALVKSSSECPIALCGVPTQEAQNYLTEKKLKLELLHCTRSPETMRMAYLFNFFKFLFRKRVKIKPVRSALCTFPPFYRASHWIWRP